MPESFDLGMINFFWRARPPGAAPEPDVPEFLPFAFTFDSDLQMIRQVARTETTAALDLVYTKNSNVGYLQDGRDIAMMYGQEFIDYVEARLGSTGKNASVLEIGCGGCYLLRALKKTGFSVTGIDPSPIAVASGEKYEIPIIAEFFPEGVAEKYDAIIHYDVLEHIADPVAFMKTHREMLKPGGQVILAVPDCTDQIQHGDLSMVIHEHINYFDMDSLRLTLEHADFDVSEVYRSKNGGVLYAHARVAQVSKTFKSNLDHSKYDSYVQAAKGNTKRILEYIGDARSSLSVYIPLRLAPYLCQARRFDNMRFFDDDSAIHGHFFDGFNVPVENFQDLKARPADRVLVASFSFGAKIKAKIQQNLPGVDVITLPELLR